MHPIENRVVVIAKHENWIYYCNNRYIGIKNLVGSITKQFTICRIVEFDTLAGVLTLKLDNPTPIDKEGYKINSEANEDIFGKYAVVNIIVHSSSRRLYHNTTSRVSNNKLIRDEVKTDFAGPLEDFIKKDLEQERFIEFKKLKLIKELTFNDGNISFEEYCSEIGKVETFSIENSFIKKEFDSIKNYFSKFFVKGKVEVTCRLKVSENDILERTALSDGILKINQDTITKIEDDLIRDSILNRETEEIKSLEDAFNDTYQALEDKQADWLMSKLAKNEITKHHRHLLYLSDRHDNTLFKLKVTGKPVSFLFGIRENENIYIVWETHNTKEATYIWKHNKSDNELQEFISDTDEHVKKLRQRTKREYRSLNKDNPNFSLVEHDYNSTDNGFDKWKDQLIKYLTNSL